MEKPGHVIIIKNRIQRNVKRFAKALKFIENESEFWRG